MQKGNGRFKIPNSLSSAYCHTTFCCCDSSTHASLNDVLCRVVGVFDTVGALGLPRAITLSNTAKTLFDFPDNILGEHIERAYHSIALDEQREDFVGLILDSRLLEIV